MCNIDDTLQWRSLPNIEDALSDSFSEHNFNNANNSDNDS